ncbi:hypothetical protein J6590_097670, partial [Homalodisca vitripennis]
MLSSSSSSSSEGITFSELNLTGEELKYLDKIGENQEHNISNILAVPDLFVSPRPPATPSGPREQSEDIISKP